jgi:hypothetical protein
MLERQLELGMRRATAVEQLGSDASGGCGNGCAVVSRGGLNDLADSVEEQVEQEGLSRSAPPVDEERPSRAKLCLSSWIKCQTPSCSPTPCTLLFHWQITVSFTWSDLFRGHLAWELLLSVSLLLLLPLLLPPLPPPLPLLLCLEGLLRQPA